MRLKTLLALLLALTASAVLYAQQSLKTFSPSGYIQLETVLNNTGELQYRLLFKNKEAVGLSSLGLRLSTPAIELNRFSVVNIDSTSKDETWETVWGEDHRIRNNYREIAYLLQNKSSTPVKLRIVFRVFNDGVGFRYEFPQQDALHHFVVADELTGFAMTGDHKTFWIPGDYDTNEYAYYTSPLSKIDASGGGSAQEIHAKTFFDKNAVQTPLMMKSADGLYLNIHEAALLNFRR